MKIQVRGGVPTGRPGQVRVREKNLYSCKECGNKYYSFHFFCPQCLGEVSAHSKHVAVLQIVSCPADKETVIDLLKKLSENQNFDFEKALRSLPWICMSNTDPAILLHWKECLEAQRVTAEILSELHPPKKGKKKPHPPLFPNNAPFPCYFTTSITEALRKTTTTIPLASYKLRWAEVVLQAFTILEGLYKNHTGRILFYDFIFQIEEQFREFMESFGSRKWSEAEFVKKADKLKHSFERMESEILEVRKQVEESL